MHIQLCLLLYIHVQCYDVVCTGESRSEYPLTCYLVAGTQAEQGRQNFMVLMKMHNLCATRTEEEGGQPLLATYEQYNYLHGTLQCT